MFHRSNGRPPATLNLTHTKQTGIDDARHSGLTAEERGNWILMTSDRCLCSAQCFRHAGWKNERSRVFDAMKLAGCSRNRLSAFAKCGSNVWICTVDSDPNQLALLGNYCRDRLCLPCANARAATVRSNLVDFVRNKTLRLVTLTLQSSTSPLKDQLDHLYASFRRLRHCNAWATTVTGGAAFLEITFNGKTGLWHPHLHVILESGYFHQSMLSDLWRTASRGSFVVHITLARNTDNVAQYVTKYVTKGIHTHGIPTLHKLAEAIAALAGRRLALTFGSWVGTPLTSVANPHLLTPMEPLDCILKEASHGSTTAILTLLKYGRLLHREHAPAPHPP